MIQQNDRTINHEDSILDASDGRSFEAIGESLGTSRESARLLFNSTLAKLKEHPDLRELNPHKHYGSL